MRCLVIATTLLLCACETGGASKPLPDADLSKPMCTGLLYDSCTSNAGCMSMNCHLYEGDGFQVCTQTCSSSNPCPNQNGTPASCNNKGICKPPAANACHP